MTRTNLMPKHLFKRGQGFALRYTVPTVNERSKLTRFQRLNLTHLLWRKAPRRAAFI